MRRAELGTALVLLTLAASPARAQGSAAAAEALFEEGRAAMARGDYRTACAKLEGSRALDAAAGTEYNLALCYDKSGLTASAWATYLSAAAAYKATNRPEWETRARDRAKALAPRLARLTIDGGAEAARVTRDGVAVVPSELGVAIPVDPGRHVVVAEREGRVPFRAEVELKEGGNERIVVVLGARTESPAPAVHAAARPEPRRGAWRRDVGVGLGIVGGAGLLLGTVSGLVALERHGTSTRDCPESGPCGSDVAIRASDAAHDWAAVSTVGFVAGGALLGAGLVLFFTAPSRNVGVNATGLVARW